MNQTQSLPTLAQILAALKENNEVTVMTLYGLLRASGAICTPEYVAQQLTFAMHRGLAKVTPGINAWELVGVKEVCTA